MLRLVQQPQVRVEPYPRTKRILQDWALSVWIDGIVKMDVDTGLRSTRMWRAHDFGGYISRRLAQSFAVWSVQCRLVESHRLAPVASSG